MNLLFSLLLGLFGGGVANASDRVDALLDDLEASISSAPKVEIGSFVRLGVSTIPSVATFRVYGSSSAETIQVGLPAMTQISTEADAAHWTVGARMGMMGFIDFITPKTIVKPLRHGPGGAEALLARAEQALGLRAREAPPDGTKLVEAIRPPPRAIGGGFSAWFIFKHMEESLLLRRFLDIGAAVAALPDFKAKDERRRLAAFMRLLAVFVKADLLANDLESVENNGFDSVFITGVGVCRHLSPTLATLLKENGYHARLAFLEPKDEPPHLWVEISPIGAPQPDWVADPMEGRLYSWPEVLAADKSDAGARMYRASDREISDAALPGGDAEYWER